VCLTALERAVRRLTANGQPALAAYAPQPGGGHRLHTLQVVTVTSEPFPSSPLTWAWPLKARVRWKRLSGRVSRNVVFADPQVLEAFDLPKEIFLHESREPR
jgi:RNA polymerase sigma-70 factor (ECF subfamily)